MTEQEAKQRQEEARKAAEELAEERGDVVPGLAH